MANNAQAEKDAHSHDGSYLLLIASFIFTALAGATLVV